MIASVEIVSELVRIIQDEFEDGFQLKDVFTITAKLVSLLQLRRELRHLGSVKKDILLMVFRQLVSESVMSDEDTERVADFILNALPTLIDSLKSLGREIANDWRREGCWPCTSTNVVD